MEILMFPIRREALHYQFATPIFVLCASSFPVVVVDHFPDVTSAQSLTEFEILGGADARIQKYRTGEAELKLIGPLGK